MSADGVSTDPQKIDKVANWPVPTSKLEVCTAIPRFGELLPTFR